MNFIIISINPNFFTSPFKNGIIYKGIKKGIIKFKILNLIDFSENRHSIDDKIYGGGSGLLIKPESLFLAIRKSKSFDKNSFVIYLSPQGKIINDNLIKKLLSYDSLTFVCGRYNGIDQRIIDNYIDMELSVGDYILSCGEISVLVVIDVLIRKIPGILNNINSSKNDSFDFCGGLLGYPNYTRPRVFNGKFVPKILLSGNHNKINIWRFKKSIKKTLINKPYLFKKYLLNKNQKKIFKKNKKKYNI